MLMMTEKKVKMKIEGGVDKGYGRRKAKPENDRGGGVGDDDDDDDDDDDEDDDINHTGVHATGGPGLSLGSGRTGLSLQ